MARANLRSSACPQADGELNTPLLAWFSSRPKNRVKGTPPLTRFFGLEENHAKGGL